MANFVLVHGAWQGAWVWDTVGSRLVQRKHRVLAIDLPGHGDNPSGMKQVTMAAYARCIADAVGQMEDVVLVGHSMGGAAISAAAELRPATLHRLIYVCAFLPRDGDSVMSLAAQAEEDAPQPDIDITSDGMAAVVKGHSIRENFMHDCGEQVILTSARRFQPQALQPLNAALALTPDGFGKYPRDYILCDDDRAVSPRLQERMLLASPCERVRTLHSSHSPFASQAALLAETLHEWGQ